MVQWVRDLALSVALVAAVAWVQSLDQELLHALGMAKKKEKERKEAKKQREIQRLETFKRF